MWKWIPFFVIVATVGYSGVLLSSALKRRRCELYQFLLGIRVIESEMNYSSSSLWLCFERGSHAVKTEIRNVFLRTAEEIRNSGNGESAFLGALESSRSDLGLTESDMEKIRRFAVGLGTSDMEHSIKNICQLREQLELSARDAEENEKKWGRVFRNGGWLMGFAAALLFV